MSSWLSDPDANRYLQMYVNNFVEISGNLICNNGAYVDINENIQLKNGAQLRFPDNTFLSTASIPLPTDISINTIDISGVATMDQLQVNSTVNIGGDTYINGNLDVSGSIIFQDDSIQTTAYTPATTISVNNFEAAGTITLPAASISNTALQSSVVLTDAVQTITNKTISSTGITDSATASLTNLSVSGTVSIPNYSPSSLTIGDLTATNITVNNSETIQQDLTVNGNVSMNQNAFINSLTVNEFDWSATNVKVRVSTGTGNVFLCSPTQVVYTSITGIPSTNDYIDPAVHNTAITNFGSNGAQITTVNSTTNVITFNQAIGAIPTANVEVYGYGLNINNIQTFSPLTVATGQGVLGPAQTDISFNDNFVSSVNTSSNLITITGACVGVSAAQNFTGIIDSQYKLISASMPPVYSLMSSGSTVQRIETLINSKAANLAFYSVPPITSTAGTVVGYVMDNLKINYATTSGTVALNQFIKSSTATDYVKGAQVSVINTTTKQIEFQASTLTRSSAVASVEGIIPYAGGNVLLQGNTVVSNNYFVEGSGITSYKNNVTGYTAGSYVVPLEITGLSKSPNTSIYGYINSAGRLVVATGTTIPLSPQPFLYDGAGLTLTVPNRVSSLFATGFYNITSPTAPTETAKTSIVGFPYDTYRFCYTTATTPTVGDFLSYSGTGRVTAVDTTKQLLTVTSPMTNVYVVQNRLGHITSTSTIQLFDTTSLAVNQGIIGTGVSDTRPYIGTLNTTTKVITMPTASLTVPTTSTVGGLFVLTSVAGVYKMGFKSSVPAQTFLTGSGITNGTYTNTTGVVTTLTYNTLPTVATARITKNLFLISDTQAVYNPIGSTTFLNNGDMLFANSLVESTISPSTYAVSPPSTTTDCSITLTNGTVTPSLAFQSYGCLRQVTTSPPAYNFHYKTKPSVGQYVYNSECLTYNNGAFCNIFPTSFDNCSLIFGNTTGITATPFAVQITGYVGTNLLPYYSYTKANYTAIMDNGLDCIVNMNDSVNLYKTGWLDYVSPNSSTIRVLRTSGANVDYTRTLTTKNYTLYQVGDKSNIYVELQAGGSGVPAIDDFIDWNVNSFVEYGWTALGVYSTGTNRYRINSAGAFTNVVQSVGQVVRFVTPQPLNFYKKQLFNVYDAVSTRVYTPNTITTSAGVGFNFLTSYASTFKYTGYTYTYLPPISYNIFSPNTYTLSTPVSMTYFNPVLYKFYTPQTTGFYGSRTINIPQITDPAGDTFALCKYPQTLTNKDLTTPTINTYSFGYVPWTAIVNHSGTYTTNPLIGVIDSTARPTPASNAATQIRYYYSVQGKNLYLNYMFYQPSAGTGGTGTYYYKIPSAFHSSLSSMLYSSSSLTSTPLPGTRVGSCRFHAFGAALEFSSVFYSTLNGGTPGLLIYREQVQYGPQSSTIFSYAVSQPFSIWFECIIPLA